MGGEGQDATNKQDQGNTATLLGSSADGKAPEGTAATGTIAGGASQVPDQKVADSDAKGKASQPKAPERYEIKLPEGSAIGDKEIEKISELARKLDLTNDQAVELASLHNAFALESSKALDSEAEATVKEWHDAVLADPELGGKNFDTTRKHAQAAMSKIGTRALQEVLDDTGLGNHPELVRVFAKIGKAMEEDAFVAAQKSATPAAKTRAETLFPNQGKRG